MVFIEALFPYSDPRSEYTKSQSYSGYDDEDPSSELEDS